MNRFLEKMIYSLRGFYPVHIGNQTFKGNPKHLFFWRIVNHGGFEPGFFKILNEYLTENSVYCDIGAWIGPTAMYAARLCKKVYAFEPDDEAYRFLQKNISKNEIGNIIPYNLAISDINGMVNMASHGGKQGDSMSSMINIEQYKNSFTAKSITWHSFINNMNPGKIDFIKMDIEGGEFLVIPTMCDFLKVHKPILHLSLHPAYLPENERERKLKFIFFNLNIYKEVYNENMEKVDVDNYLENISSSADFTAFLFIP